MQVDPQEEVDRIFDEDLVNRLRDRPLNRQYWDDEEAWLCNAAWLTLPCHYQATLESVWDEIGIDATPFGRLNSWFLRHGIRKEPQRYVQTPGCHQLQRARGRQTRRH